MPLSAPVAVRSDATLSPAELTARRQDLALSQRELGKLLGVQRNTVARWERGAMRMAHPDMVAAMLEALEGQHPRLPPASDAPNNNAGNLPSELSSFVGREDAVTECCRLLRERRMITLTGPGGIGKSRLALQMGRCSAPVFRNGVFLVELASVEEPRLVPRLVAGALGLVGLASDALTDLLVESLRFKQVLLILDDCDRQVETCRALAERMLHDLPGLSVVATSREPLDIRGEAVWRVPPLRTPAPGASVEETGCSEAVHLFVERAREVAPWFELDASNTAEVGQLCRRLDGIPLAIELAAAHLKALSLPQLVARLERSLDLLARQSHAGPTRQQTLRATIDWSYALLNEAEKALFRRLAVFSGGFVLEAVEAVTQGPPIPSADTLRVLERLIDKSLVVSETREGVLRQTMLDTVCEYAREHLVESGEEAEFRRRHFEWILGHVAAIDPSVLTTSMVKATRLEVDNLRAALAWAIDSGEAEGALRLAVLGTLVWQYRGHFAEGIAWLERTLAMPANANRTSLRARALKRIAVLSFGLGDVNAARSAIVEAQSMIHDELADIDLPLCAGVRANIERGAGNLEDALRLYRQVLTEYQKRHLRFWEQVVLFMMASALFELGEYAESRAACERCLALGGPFAWATARARIILAYVTYHDADSEGARQLAQQALTELRNQHDALGVGIALRALSQLALEQGRLGCAWTCLAECLDIALMQGDRIALARTLETVACVLASRAPAEAAQIAGAAASLRARTGTVPWPTEQARLDRWLTTARATLGGRLYVERFRLGTHLSDAEAAAAARLFVAEALAGQTSKSVVQGMTYPLTARQREVASLVARGLTNEQIAAKLVISPSTARAHVEHMLDRLNLHSRAQLAAWTVAHRPETARRLSESSDTRSQPAGES
jgi:predicted ATPase/DNA-binding CsgD family transcriptional regulator/DNA-binding XRE family transcriptional regulator